MANKASKVKARLPRGFVDRHPADIRAVNEMVEKIRAVYERYGFDPIETPLMEYTDTLGKFLPDQDRPNEGVFSIQDDDEQWMSLRYDLTAPLARHVAENFNEIQLPYRTYRAGWVFRNEKPGPGRFRQFMQFDADTVGAPSVAADAEMCMMMADVMEALGIKRGDYVIRVNNRKVLDGVMEAIGVSDEAQKLTVLRAIDKADKFPISEIEKLLTDGRWDGGGEQQGDFTPGAGLSPEQANDVLKLVQFSSHYSNAQRNGEADESRLSLPNPFTHPPQNWVSEISLQVYNEHIGFADQLINLNPRAQKYEWNFGIEILGFAALLLKPNSLLFEGLRELADMASLFQAAGYLDEGNARILIDPSVVRGLEYYTGPVFEAELTAEIPNEKGEIVRFGSVGGGGRYDGLVSRFRGQPVPATGFSIGVSRLMTALKNLGKLGQDEVLAPVLVTVMDGDMEAMAKYQAFTQKLRNAGIRAEMYQGNWKKFGNQLKYADRRGSPLAIIQGADERAEGVVQIKDLIEGKKLSAEIESNEEWRSSRPAQFSVKEDELVEAVTRVLEEQRQERDGV